MAANLEQYQNVEEVKMKDTVYFVRGKNWEAFQNFI
jgi:hypothetical protein